MSETDKNKDELEESTYRELRLLEEVEIKPEVSQRHLASQLGVALGVANLLVKNLAKKGYMWRKILDGEGKGKLGLSFLLGLLRSLIVIHF